MFTRCHPETRKTDERTYIRQTDRQTDVQRETIIPCHYYVAGYINVKMKIKSFTTSHSIIRFKNVCIHSEEFKKYSRSITFSAEDCDKIEVLIRNQSDSALWKAARAERITASNCGEKEVQHTSGFYFRTLEL